VVDGRVFISYGSQDSAIANSLVEALEHNGTKCWIAPRDVVAGEFYADAIVHAIDAARALVLVLSQSSAASHHILREVERASSKRHPVITLRIDRAPLPAGLEYFLNTSHWLDAADTDPDRAFPKLIEAVRRALTGAASAVTDPSAKAVSPEPASRLSGRNRVIAVMASLIIMILASLAIDKIRSSRRAESAHPAATTLVGIQPPATPPTVTATAFTPPPHSIAVLPFVNMSGDPNQEYFSDGVTEELLNSLSRLQELQVVARTSSFSFKGQNADISTIAHKLNLGAILEGSVRRAGNTVRITVQLINAVTGFHTWSQTYDRNLTDILKIQTDVATSVANELRTKLSGNEVNQLELGGTTNVEAYDAYLRGLQLLSTADSETEFRDVLRAANRAGALDRNYAAALVLQVNALWGLYAGAGDSGERDRIRELARNAAERAVTLAPELAEAHTALGRVVRLGMYQDVGSALPELETAMALAPGNASVQSAYGSFQGLLGHHEVALAAIRRAIALDPQNYRLRVRLMSSLYFARHFEDAIAAGHEVSALKPNGHEVGLYTYASYLALGQPDRARQMCESPSSPALLDDDNRNECLAFAYHALGRTGQAKNALEKLMTTYGDSRASSYAEIYSQWGDKVAALDWLATAMRARNPAIALVKVNWMFDPIRNEPQFKAIEAAMHFPPDLSGRLPGS
jgi:serine/threonine-protein kinase